MYIVFVTSIALEECECLFMDQRQKSLLSEYA